MNNRVKEVRTARGMTQSELAGKIQVSRQTIYAIESSKYVPSVVLALKIAAIFETTADALFDLEDSDWK
ncbi:putative transcriptional regulator [Cyclonatronum proteinivorum]|uniref:Putative transcriptional regulator n=1 Tax=Cyclonatronum proteinivorum TaxID=1457365 RepID=A0A345UJI9_9BACT|nr:helix-turn-helix transcriptional regulator [Cyclonatronum proteinivorum]AXJ00641.1 putative transcriptional regulator [Cyclonatronum proteinivorum]